MTSIRVPFALEATPAMGMIDKLVGGMKKLTGAIGKTGVAALAAGVGIGIFTARYLSKATQEAITFQREMIGLTKILGEKAATPIGGALGDLSERLPVAREALVSVAETAARLGIRGQRNILQFTETMAKMGIATNITAEEAADAMARIAKQTGLPIAKLQNLGSVINELSNNMATSTSEIVASMRRSAPELARLGLTADQIAALASTLNTVSESATRAGTRLRRFGQALSDPNKVGVFAKALDMTETAFRDFMAENPEAAILKIVKAMEEGGQASETLASGLDARVRLALAALAQVRGDLEVAFKSANREMRENISLQAEVDRILGLVVSKQEIYNNQIKELRREIGEEVLPVYQKLLEIKLKFLRGLAAIVETPLEGMFDEQTTKRAKDQAKKYIAAWKVEVNRGNVERDPLATGVIDERQIVKTLNYVRQENLRGMAQFGEQYLELTNLMLDDPLVTPTEMITMWAQLSSIMGSVDDQLEGQQDRSMAVGRELWRQIEVLRAQGASAETIYQRVATAFRGLGVIFDQSNKRATQGIGILTDEQIQMLEEYVSLVDAMAAKVREAKGDENEMRQLLESDVGYRTALEDIKRLTAKTEVLTKVELDRLESARLYVDMVQASVRDHDVYLKQLKQIEDAEIQRANSLAMMSSKMEEAAQVQEFIAEMNREFAQEGKEDWEIWMDTQLRWLDTLTTISDETRRTLRQMIMDHAEWRAELGQESEMQAYEKRLEALKKKLDLSTVDAKFRLLEDIIRSLADTTIELFEAMITGSSSVGDAIVNMIRSVVEEIIRANVMNFFLGLLGPEGWDIMNILGSVTGNKKGKTGKKSGWATGGNIQAGRLAVVGERGPELFVPNVGGKIIPNNKLGVGQSETIILNNSFTINALDGSSVREVLAREQDFITGLSIDKIQRHRALKRR